MQNAPTMLGQKMMNRQAPYGPIGMVSQDMSGNKKGARAAPAAPGLTFDPITATAGMTFSNNNVTATNSTGGAISSAKGSVTTVIGVAATYYWEFIVNSSGTARFGVGPASFVCDAANQVGGVVNSIAYQTTGNLFGNGSNLGGVSTTTTGDVLGFKLVINATTSTLTVYKNNVVDLNNYNSTSYVSGHGTAWVPIWSSGVTLVSASISNSIYEQAGTIPLGNPVITASASVPAVADGKYDVYTFNASGTFTVASTGAVRALVIAGGGGAVSGARGAGGAGGYLENGVTVTPQTYTVTVGPGGTPSNNGNPSSIGSLISTVGGGRGGFDNGSGASGGSGGGGSPTFPGPDTQSGGAGTAGQGFAGGSGDSDFATYVSGGGGGGAGGVGQNGTASFPSGNGGIGKASDITGTSISRGGGGAGNAGTASSGGGASGNPGTPNTGGGAGGNGGSGGSGVVIIRVRARA